MPMHIAPFVPLGWTSTTDTHHAIAISDNPPSVPEPVPAELVDDAHDSDAVGAGVVVVAVAAAAVIVIVVDAVGFHVESWWQMLQRNRDRVRWWGVVWSMDVPHGHYVVKQYPETRQPFVESPSPNWPLSVAETDSVAASRSAVAASWRTAKRCDRIWSTSLCVLQSNTA